MKNMMPDDLRCVKVEWENQLQEISKELNELGGQSIPLMWNLPMVLSIVMRSHGTLTWKRECLPILLHVIHLHKGLSQRDFPFPG